MQPIVLDTNILVHILRGSSLGEEINTYLSKLDQPQFLISVVTVAEIKSLAIQWGWGDKKNG